MIPVVFDQCFGLLHPAAGSKGVVMCSPLGFEELGTRRSWRDLAESLSNQGHPTLRFDYHGVNDSLGREEDPNRIDTWIGNIIQAVAFLRSTCKVKNVSLVGLRFGATLAVLSAAAIEDIDDIVLIAPVVSGRSYVRELRLVADAWWAAASPMTRKEHTTEYVDVIGNRLYTETLNSFNQIDLRKLRKIKANRILLLDPGQKPDVTQFAKKLDEISKIHECFAFNGLEDYLRDSVNSITPQTAFNKIVDWLGNGGDLTKNNYDEGIAQFNCADFKEKAMWFGTDNKLFGILTKPIDPSVNCPAVMILNTGPNLHTGNGRLSVLLARYLALLGVTSLRFDLAGIGESEIINGRKSPLYTLEAIGDVSDASDLLVPYSNDQGIVAVGLCSGAFLCFHAALSEKRITGAVIVNLQRFIWKEGTSLQVGGKRTKRSTKFYLKAARRKATWIRILKGEGDVMRTLLTLASRSLRRMQSQARMSPEGNTGSATELVMKWARKLSNDGKHIRFWYSEDDPGLSELEEYFGTNGKYLSNLTNIKIGIIPDADHSLNSYAARMKFIAMFEAYLREGFNQDIPIIAPA